MPSENIIFRKDGKKYKLKSEENKKLFFWPDEWLNFYSLIKDKNKICFDILINTGARINEARYITPKNVSEERGTLFLAQTKVRALEGEKKPTGRLIPISSEFLNKLLKYAKNNNLKEDDKFPMLSTAQMNKLIKENSKLINKQGWYDLSAHNIRKTFECWLIALGVMPLVVANHLGHSLSVAQKYYISPDVFRPNDKILIRRILGDIYLR